MKNITDRWETARVTVQTGQLEEAPELLDVFNSCNYVEPWDPTFKPVLLDEIIKLIESSLGVGEDADERFLIQTMRRKDSGEVIGYFHVYHGVPSPSAVWISIFLVRPDLQKQHYGQEAFDGLVDQIRACGWNSLWLKVYLKNWPAIRFWTRNGFTQIKEVRGDEFHAQNTHAALVLEKRI